MAQRIPKHFHFVFGLRPQKQAFHVIHYLCLESCLQVNQPERISLYYHYMPFGPYWERIKPKLELVYVDLNPAVTGFHYADQKLNEFRYAHQADFIRLEKILQHGGVYADIDTLFLNPIGEHLYEEQFVIGREPIAWEPVDGRPRTSLCNAFLMSEPNSSFGRRWLEAMSEAFDGSWSNHSTFLPQRLADAYPDEVHIEAEESYYGFEPSQEGLFRLFEDPHPVEAHKLEKFQSIHLWEHFWWDRKRIDFSPVHQGMLTEQALRTGQANYHRLARRFLPEEAIVAGEQGTSRWEQSQEWIEGGLRYGRALGGALLLPAIQKFFPSVGRLDLARSYLAYCQAQRQFVDLSEFERARMRWVIQWDEYGVFQSRLKADDVVIDVGAQIGLFSFACWAAGSRAIFSFEPNPLIYAKLQRNVGALPGVEFREQAIGLDEILRRFERVKLLKLDCEGSKFPILRTSKELGRVERIVGVETYQISVLEELLRSQGFQVKSSAVSSGAAYFEAWR
jgi:hypothetical protein